MQAATPFGLATIEQAGLLAPAVVTHRGVATLSAVLGTTAPGSVRGLFPDWDHWCDRISAGLDATALPWVRATEVAFAAPLPDASSLYLAGANYHDHVAEMNRYAKSMRPDESPVAENDMFHFMVPATSLVGTGRDVVRPIGADQLDWEVELAVVIGRRAEAVDVEHALDFVAGYAVANDVSVRGPATMHPIFGVRFLVAKGQSTLTPMGPMIVPARFVHDPQDLALSTRVNGQVRQDSSTSQMIFSVREQIASLSRRATLLPGDIILTGTPAGTAAAFDTFLLDGDVITMTVEGLGTLINTVVGTPA